MRSIPQHGDRHAPRFPTALRWGLVLVCLWGLVPSLRSQWVETSTYRQITPYRADLVGTASWTQSGRPGIQGAELTVPANTFLRSISIRMGDSPDPKGGFQLHLFRIPRLGSTGGLDHVARLKGTGNPATAGSHVYQIPSGLALSGRYLLVAMVSQGGGTYRWMVEPGSKTGSDGSVFYGVFVVPDAPTIGGSTGSGSSAVSGGSLQLRGTVNSTSAINLGTSLILSNGNGSSLQNLVNGLNNGSGNVLTLGGSLSIRNPNSVVHVFSPLNNGGSNPGNQTTLGGSTTINLNPIRPLGLILSANTLTMGSTILLNPIPTSNPTPNPPLIGPPGDSTGTIPGNLILNSGGVITIQGGIIRPHLAGPAPSSEEPAEEETASAFLSASSEVAAAEEDGTRLLLLPDLGENGRFALTLQQGLARALVEVQRPKPFSPVAVGSQGPTQRLRIRNLAEARIEGLSIHATGETKRDFQIIGTPRRTLAAGEATEFRITAAPRRPGLRRGLVEIRTQAGSEFLSVSVRGVRAYFAPRGPSSGGN